MQPQFVQLLRDPPTLNIADVTSIRPVFEIWPLLTLALILPDWYFIPIHYIAPSWSWWEESLLDWSRLIRQDTAFKYAGWYTKWSSIAYINKIFISITVLETNMQKERPLYEDLSSVNQVFNITTITSGNFFNSNCDVDYSMAHVLSYFVGDLNN
jgi:hypothetical protein